MFQDDLQPENHLERSPALPIQALAARCGSAAQTYAHCARNSAVGAGGGDYQGLGFLVSAGWGSARSRGLSARVKVSVPLSRALRPRQHEDEKRAKPSACGGERSASVLGHHGTRSASPLQVEVVAGNRHVNVPAKSNAIHLDVDSGATSSLPQLPALRLSCKRQRGHCRRPRAALAAHHAECHAFRCRPTIHLLARQMKVQGAVSSAGADFAGRHNPGVADSQWAKRFWRLRLERR